MNHWTQLSINFANQRNYLDELFHIYPTIPEGIREINKTSWQEVEQAFDKKNNSDLIKALLRLKLFPLKDSYVAYLRRDNASIGRNPKTVARLCGRLYEIGLDKIYENCSEPKETNRQMGPAFKRWLTKGGLGIQPVSLTDFQSNNENAILNASDAQMKAFAQEYLNYNHSKGLDFVARFNKTYIIGEAKFLTDFGGHQNAQFADAISTINSETNKDVIKIAILDGVLYIEGENKMHQDLKNHNIMSALVLREFLYQV